MLSSKLDGQVAVSVCEACAMLGISKSLAYEVVASGELRSVRLGRRILIPLSAIEELVEGRQRDASRS